MDRLPFGIKQLDGIVNGGAPAGSVVLLSGEAGAGSRAFMYTCAVMNGLATLDHDLFDLHYGDLAGNATLPDGIHYLSFTATENQLRDEIAMTVDEEIATPALETVEFTSLTRQYFHVSPVPRDWYASEAPDITDLRKRHEEREGLLTSLGNQLTRHAAGNVVLIDSLSDLVGAIGDDLEWSDITYLVHGLQRAAHEWDGLILLHVNHEAITSRQHAQLVEACDGAMQFQWESGGSTRARTMIVQSFRGVLSQLEDEDIVQFETELGEAGFDISDVRKIR